MDAAAAALFAQSLWMGLAIAAPVGPIGLLVIQRTLRHGAALGLATGLGAAVADAAYGAVGAFGVAALIRALQALRLPLVLAGGGFLLWLAWRTWRDAARTPAAGAGAADAPPRLRAAFAGTVALTLSNPATILSFVAIFGSLAGQGAAQHPAWMVAGVFIGSALWWLLLCAAVALLRRRVPAGLQRGIGRASALMLAAFALWQWGQLAPGVAGG